MLPITLIVIAKNEARMIGRCLDSVPFADDKVVVDSGSSDGTPEIAAAHGARVVHQEWLGFGPQRNFATGVAKWLLAHGTPRSAKLGKLRAKGWHAQLMNAITPTRASWNGHNSSCWRDDLLKVNGHDERMAYWAQDREFGERLVNAGVRGLQIRYSAICVHINHDRPYKTEVSRERNRQIRAETRQQRATWTEHGILKVPQPSHVFATNLADDVIVEHHGTLDYRTSAAA